MHPTQSQLYADHYNFLRLLRCLESELTCYEADQAGHAKLAVILDIFEYVQFYPQKFHHPIEDLVFELLLIKQVECSEDIWAVKSEHKKLEELTRRAAQLFISVANDTVVAVDDLITVTREFINRHVDHINKENRLVYPLLEKIISDLEWDEVTKKVRENNISLFDGSIHKEYKNLYKAIIQAERRVVIDGTAKPIKKRIRAS